MSSLEFQTVKEALREVEAGLVPIIFGLKKGDMAAIDYATCGINDVIAQSLKLHPRLLADCVRSDAGVHAEFADAYGDPEVTRNELGLADRLASFADAIGLGDYTIPDDPMCAAKRSAVRRGCKIYTRSCRK